jgi:hypothetical protein
MKTSLTKFLAFGSVALLMLASCKKNDPIIKTNGGTAGALTANTTTPVLDKAKLADTTKVVSFTVTTPVYGYSAAVTNTLQIDSTGDNWKKPMSVTLGTKVLSQSYSTGDFNALLLKLNLPAGKPSQIQVRVEHSLGAGAAPIYSNVLSLTVTPFNLISYVYLPGSYQNTDPNKQWSPTTADSLVSPTGNGVYTGYAYFQAGSQFKVTPAKNWGSSYGDAGGGKISLTSGGNLTAPAAGLYLVTVNTNTGTIAYSAYDHTWSVIGDAAIDWNTDVNMTFNQNANAYQVTTTLKASGSFKFRADNAWTLSLGNMAPVTGQLTSTNGANLSAPVDGIYLVSLSFGDPLLAPGYTLTKQ